MPDSIKRETCPKYGVDKGFRNDTVAAVTANTRGKRPKSIVKQAGWLREARHSGRLAAAAGHRRGAL